MQITCSACLKESRANASINTCEVPAFQGKPRSAFPAWFRQRVRSNPYAFEPLRHSFAVMNWISSAWGYQMIPSWTRACCEWHAEARRQAAFSYVVISKQPSRSRQPPQKGQLLPPGTTTGCQNSSKHAGKGLCQITWGQVHKKA